MKIDDESYNIHKELTDLVQRLLNGLLPGTVLPVHLHPHTDETYVALKGRIKVSLRPSTYFETR